MKITLTQHTFACQLLDTIKAYIDGEKGIIDLEMKMVMIDQAAHCFSIMGFSNPRSHAVTFVEITIKSATK